MNARRFLLGAALGLTTLTAIAADWPQWRGAGRDNRVTDFTPPPSWPKALSKKWSVSVGDGLASPALVGDKVYVFTRKGGDEVITCVDAGSGQEAWADKYAAEKVTPPASGRGQDSFTGPRSSPAVGGGKVCTLGVGGVVSCLDAGSGKVAWRKETKSKPRFFTSCSPLIVEGVCIVFVGSDGKGQLTAFDLSNGEEKWKWAGDGPSYGSPVAATIGGVRQVVTLTETNLVGVSMDGGKLLWKTPLKTGRYQTGTPVVDGDTVICAGTAFTIEKQGDGFAAKQLWKDQPPHLYNTPVLKDGVLFGLTGMGLNSTLYCQDAKTGKVLWMDRTNRGQCGYILDAGSVMLCLSTNSELVVFKPSKEGYEELAKYKVADSPTWAEPIIAGNRVFVKDKDNLTLWAIE